MDTTNKDNNNNSNKDGSKSVHLVFQRFRHCRLLLNEDTVVHVGSESGNGSPDGGNDTNDDHDSIDQLLLNPYNTNTTETDTDTDAVVGVVGLLVYVSFANTATKDSVYNAAKTVLNLPIITLGSWGDGTSTQSLLQLAAGNQDMSDTTIKINSSSHSSSSPSYYYNVNLVIVPQANLISKVKSNGKSIQYHGQCPKTVGEEWYDYFVKSLYDIATEYQAIIRKEEKLYNKSKNTNKSDDSDETVVDVASIPPKDYFRYIDKDKSKYGSYDATTGIPQTTADGEPLTKSAIKKIKKLYDLQCKKYEKYIEKQQQQKEKQDEDEEEIMNKKEEKNTEQQQQEGKGNTSTTTEDATNTEKYFYELDSKFIHIVSGTFGKRQGLTITSDMGPFCHVVQI